ncbi:MAG TPA: YceI family protein [Lacibacter sp.]|nr:YceI family protein [Lacibacter sp.]
MKYLIVFLVFLCQTAVAQTYSPVDAGDAIQFRIKNLGFDVNGSFRGLKGKILFTADNLSACNIDVAIDASTVNTDNSTRDKHLRGKDYFDVTANPQIKITSERIAKSVTPGYYVFFGKLSMKGVVQNISFPFKATEESGGIRFTGTFSLKRRDFGVGGRSTISNDVDIKLNVLTKKL